MKPIWLRGIVEISNRCRNNCLYCGIRAANAVVRRYCLDADRILAAATTVRQAGCGTIVLQAGDHPGLDDETICEVVRRLKRDLQFPAVTLSLGVKTLPQLAAYRAAGADRYLLRFETSNPARFAAIHPDETLEQRLACLRDIRQAGLWVGTGFMIGLPGQTEADLEQEIAFTAALQPDMVGCGPFIPNPQTPLAGAASEFASLEPYYRAIRRLRELLPNARIPATTAFDALEPGGRRKLLLSGFVDVYMPNFTPTDCRGDYLLYPGKPGVDETPERLAETLLPDLRGLGLDPIDEWGDRNPLSDGVIVNGKPRPLPLPCTLSAALACLGVRGQVATEVNGTIVQSDARPQTVLKPGDSLEVITFVGGG
ncbi:MAG: [FeFe] hydrogenase H-cluster radical SAM maturase HydE [Kiritimatiellia bacterium]|nr:[FeFe] hydrogenase H-cluster radical SAM maturase HydE [Kiritimatiellia bacterium]